MIKIIIPEDIKIIKDGKEIVAKFNDFMLQNSLIDKRFGSDYNSLKFLKSLRAKFILLPGEIMELTTQELNALKTVIQKPENNYDPSSALAFLPFMDIIMLVVDREADTLDEE